MSPWLERLLRWQSSSLLMIHRLRLYWKFTYAQSNELTYTLFFNHSINQSLNQKYFYTFARIHFFIDTEHLHFFIHSSWQREQKRSELPESMVLVTVPPFANSCARLRYHNTPPTAALSVERILSRDLVLESGTASLARRPWLEEPTVWALLPL